MKAIRFHKNRGPEVLIYEKISTSTPKAGEVLIKIEAIGINHADTMRRHGDVTFSRKALTLSSKDIFKMHKRK